MTRERDSGPPKGEVPYPCPGCGRLRWYRPSVIAKLRSPLCVRCTIKRQYASGERVQPKRKKD